MVEARIGLSPDAVCEVLPFHFVLDAGQRFLQVGPGLKRLDPRIGQAAGFGDAFDLVRPQGALSAELMASNRKVPLLIRHRTSGIRLRGQFLEAGSQRWLFAGSPWFETAEALEASGLSLSDFAPQDPIADLLMLEQTRAMAMDDLKMLAQRLEEKNAEILRTEDLYRRAIAAARAVPYRENFLTGSFEFIGERIAALTGIAPGELTPGRLAQLVVETIDAPLSGPQEEDGRSRDLCIRAVDGELRWLNDSCVPVKDASGQPVGRIGVILDITGRRRREEALKASEAKASLLAEVVSRTKNPVMMTDVQRRALWVNPAFEAIAGMTLDEIKGKRMPEMFELQEVGEPEVGFRTLLDAGQAVVTEVRVRRRDGVTRQFNVEWQPLFDEQGEHSRWMSVATDVTDLRRVQESLQKQEARSRRLAMVAARTDNAVILTDVQQRIEWVNDGFSRMTGYTLDDVRGKVPGHVLQCPETDPGTVRMIRERLGARQGFNCEILNRRKDDRLYWAAVEVQPITDDSGRVTAYMAIESDITDRKRQAERLRELGAELETILALSPDGYAMFNVNGTISYCNAAFGRALEADREALQGLGYEAVDRMFEAACVSRPAPIASLVYGAGDRVVNRGLPGRALARSFISIANGSSGQRGGILFLHDVTNEETLQQAQSKLLATAAHELRTPMTSVQGFSELLLEDSLDPETARDIAGAIHRQSSALVDMVNDLLDLQRIEQRRGRKDLRSTQPLQPIIRLALLQLKIAGDSRVVDLEGLPQEPVPVWVDAAQIVQALTNVLSNAYKYSPSGGAITLSLERRVDHGLPQVGIRIRDRGIGMTPEQLGQVFERFYRANPSGPIPGTGLGMPLVKEIIELHGGEAEVASELGSGTTVTLWLPLSSGAAVSEQASRGA